MRGLGGVLFPLGGVASLAIFTATRELEWLIWAVFMQNMWIINRQNPKGLQ